MAEIQNRCDQPECEKWACSPDSICEVYTDTIKSSCQNLLGNESITKADQIFLKHLNRGCTKPN
jgi:hypothetical protein